VRPPRRARMNCLKSHSREIQIQSPSANGRRGRTKPIGRRNQLAIELGTARRTASRPPSRVALLWTRSSLRSLASASRACGAEARSYCSRASVGPVEPKLAHIARERPSSLPSRSSLILLASVRRACRAEARSYCSQASVGPAEPKLAHIARKRAKAGTCRRRSTSMTGRLAWGT
jgi:hypothetical protein